MKKEVKPLTIKIDAKSALPVYEQIKQAIKLAILSRYLAPGDQLQPIRELALQLAINPNTILKVYNQLENESFIYSQHGSGFYVRVADATREKGKTAALAAATDTYIENALSLGFSPLEVELFLKERLAQRNASVKNEEVEHVAD